jgi:hypothetical protein
VAVIKAIMASRRWGPGKPSSPGKSVNKLIAIHSFGKSIHYGVALEHAEDARLAVNPCAGRHV